LKETVVDVLTNKREYGTLLVTAALLLAPNI